MSTTSIGLIALLILAMFVTATVLADIKNESIVVAGCEVCKEKIENAAESVEGVKRANWEGKSQELEIFYDNSETNLDEIEMAVAEAGFDTPNHIANDDAQNQLPDSVKEVQQPADTIVFK